MAIKIELTDLARELGEIASATTDPETGRQLTELIERMLEAAGLPPDDDAGGGELPGDWVHDIAASADSL